MDYTEDHVIGHTVPYEERHKYAAAHTIIKRLKLDQTPPTLYKWAREGKFKFYKSKWDLRAKMLFEIEEMENYFGVNSKVKF